MDLIEDIIDVETSDGTMAVVHKRPTGGDSFPRVAIFMDAPGIRPALHDFTAKLAAEGYDIIVPDLYHREVRLFGVEPAQRAADPSLAARIGELMATLTDEGIQSDLDDAMDAVAITSDDKVGVIGFCLGARAVSRTMMRLPDQAVAGAMWHPSLLTDDNDDSPHLSIGDLTGQLYIGIGTADQVQSIESHKRYFDVIESMDNVELEIFEGADHGFTWPGYPTYQQNASDTCFAKTTTLFGAALG